MVLCVARTRRDCLLSAACWVRFWGRGAEQTRKGGGGEEADGMRAASDKGVPVRGCAFRTCACTCMHEHVHMHVHAHVHVHDHHVHVHVRVCMRMYALPEHMHALPQTDHIYMYIPQAGRPTQAPLRNYGAVGRAGAAAVPPPALPSLCTRPLHPWPPAVVRLPPFGRRPLAPHFLHMAVYQPSM